MLAALVSADAVTWLSILVKSLTYAATLSAVGAVLILASLREVTETGRASLRRTAVLSAVAAGVFSTFRLPVRASFLMGGTWDGAWDPAILGLVLDSPLGSSIAVRMLGLLFILCVVLQTRMGQRLALAGAVLASVSFALRGHALGSPQIVLGALLTIHILGLSFWVGALGPLARAAKSDPPARAGALAHEFGHRAIWAVGLLVLAGTGMLVLFGVGTPAALSSTYGQMFAIKLILFAGVLFFAAVNKLWLTPALRAAAPGAAKRLRRSIGQEASVLAVVLVTTATLTTLSSPPGPAPEDQVSRVEGPTIPRLPDV